MARAIIDTAFPSAAETAHVLGVSRMNTRRLIELAKDAATSTRRRKGRAKLNGKKARSQARKSSR